MDVKMLERAVEAYSPQGDEADRARLGFFAGVYRLQGEWANRVAAASGRPAPAAEQVEAWYRDRLPALSQAPLDVEPDLFAQALEAFAAYTVDKAGLDPDAAAGLSQVDWRAFCAKAPLAVAGRDPAAFVESCLSQAGEFGIGADVPVSLLGLVLGFALRAWLQVAADAVAPLLPADHTNHDCPVDCPVCGTPAAASFVGESAGTDGRGRMQYCAACGCTWQYERIRCGVCGTHNQTKLHYFNLEGDDAHRIQSCDACGQYQRVVFQDGIPGPLCMEVEDVVMAKLDRIALDPRFRKEAAR